MKNLLISISLVLTAQIISFAQIDYREGYIIKANGDSVSGFVAYQSKSQSTKNCFFKQSKDQPAIKYSPAEVSAYGFLNDKRFESKELFPDSVTKNGFLEVLVKGNLTLYRYNKAFYLEKDKLIELPLKQDKLTGDDNRQIKQDVRYIGILNYVLSDCKLSANHARYDQRSIQKLVQNYNRCKGGNNGFSYNSKKNWAKVNFQIVGGLGFSSLKFTDAPSASFKKSYEPVGGISIDISSPKINDKFFLSIELLRLRSKYVGYYQKIYSSNGFDRYNYNIDVTYLKIPISIRYNFLSEPKTPYIKFGISESWNIKSSAKYTAEFYRYGSTDYYPSSGEFAQKTQFGLWGGLGFSATIIDRVQGFVEVRYERCNGYSLGTFINQLSSSKNVSFLIGLRF